MSHISIQLELNDKPNKDGQTSVRVRISDSTSSERHKRKNTDVKVIAGYWTGIHGSWIDKSHPEALALNLRLAKTLIKYKEAYSDLTKADELVPTKEDVLNTVVKKVFHLDFLKYFDEKTKAMKNYNQRKGYVTTYGKILEYTKGKTLSFNQVNEDWLRAFEADLFDEELASSSVHSQMKRIRAVFGYAKKDKVIDKNLYPFGRDGYLLPAIEDEKELERLDKDELSELFKQKYDKEGLKFWVHKAFCLSFLTAGTRVEDIMTLKWSNVRNGSIGYNMKKGSTGGTRKSFGLDNRLQKLLLELQKPDQKDTDYIFPFVTKGIEKFGLESDEYKMEIGRKTSLYNKYLKQIADDIATDKRLTSHIARHTWSAIVYEETKDIKLIQENLGHKNIQTTIKYIGRLSTKKNDEILSNVYNNLF